jgi:hypothetical protein
MKQIRFSPIIMSMLLALFSCSQIPEKNSIEEEISTETTDDIDNSDSTASPSDTIINANKQDKRNNALLDQPQNTPKPTPNASSSSTSNSANLDFSELRGSGSGRFDASHPDWDTGTGSGTTNNSRTRLNNVNLDHISTEESGKIVLRLVVDASGKILSGTHVINKTQIEDHEIIQKVINAVVEQVQYAKTINGETTFELYTIYLK